MRNTCGSHMLTYVCMIASRESLTLSFLISGKAFGSLFVYCTLLITANWILHYTILYITHTHAFKWNKHTATTPIQDTTTTTIYNYNSSYGVYVFSLLFLLSSLRSLTPLSVYIDLNLIDPHCVNVINRKTLCNMCKPPSKSPRKLTNNNSTHSTNQLTPKVGGVARGRLLVCGALGAECPRGDRGERVQAGVRDQQDDREYEEYQGAARSGRSRGR